MPENEQGFNPKRYQVIPRTLIFLFDGDGRVLLLKGRPDKKIWPGLYNGLGGHIESGEDVLAAAQRELDEECGIARSQLILCGIITINLRSGNGIILFVFKGKYDGQELKEGEEGILEWIEMDQLEQVKVVKDLRVILPVIHRHQAGDEPFYARYAYDDQDRLTVNIKQD